MAPTGAAGLICLAWARGRGFTGPGGQRVRAIPQPEKGMTVTIVETRAQTRAITGGVDTHSEVHVAAALDPVGGLLGTRAFPATADCRGETAGRGTAW